MNKATATLKGRTMFLTTVKSPARVSRLLQPASNNAKLGNGQREISKGKWKGMPMYQLTLEERKTCPKTCAQWEGCYGNNMPFANRVNHDSGAFFSSLAREVSSLASRHSAGFVVRLHVLGDFYSVQYVQLWQKLMRDHPELRVFGYTHRPPSSPIGRAIAALNGSGAWIRWSDAGDVPMAANVEGAGITCPEQTGKTASCMTCGLCWSTPKPINFLRH